MRKKYRTESGAGQGAGNAKEGSAAAIPAAAFAAVLVARIDEEKMPDKVGGRAIGRED
jgi:hypothetical protein